MSIGSLNFNWLPRMSAYQELQNWRIQQANAQIAADTTSALISNFGNAATNQIQGVAKLAAQAALTRIQAATKAKQDASANANANLPTDTSSAPTSVSLSTGEVIPIDPSINLGSGTRVNLSNNTMTMSDGTLIDLRTGLKKTVDVTA